ncbi:MAG: hypothetical protein K8F30_05510, partial [Taibaiella sp.]|nr:hypothetical protein [Taibaiella sp.]
MKASWLNHIRRTIESEYGATAAKKVAVLSFGVIGAILVARFLGTELRGQYAVILNWVAILSIFMNFGVNSSYQNGRLEGGTRAAPIYVAYSIALWIGLGVVVLFSARFVSDTWVMIGALVCVSVLRLHLQTYHMIESLVGDAKVVVCGHVIYVAILISIYLFLPSMLVLAVLALLTKELCVAVLSLVGLSKALQQSDGGGEHHHFFRDLAISLRHFSTIRLKAPLPFFFLSVLIVVNYKIDVLFLDGFGVESALIGVFSMGVVISEYLWVFSDVFKDVQVSRTARGGKDVSVAVAARLAIFVTLLVYLTFLLAGAPFVIFALGDEFAGSFEIACLMLIANIFMIPCKILGAYFISIGKITGYIASMTAAVLVN